MKQDKPTYTPRAEYPCDNSTTHYQGCQCHEARHSDEIARLTAELTQAKSGWEMALQTMEQIQAQTQNILFVSRKMAIAMGEAATLFESLGQDVQAKKIDEQMVLIHKILKGEDKP